MKSKFVFKFYSILIVIVLLLGTGIPGGVQRASADSIGNMLVWPQTGYVELGHCNLGDAFTLIVDDGTNIVYVSLPTTCVLRADGYHYAGFQVVHYTMKPGDIVTVLHGSDSKELVITPEGTHSVDVVADTIQGVNQGTTHLGVVASGYWLDVYPAEDGSWLADFSGKVDLIPGMRPGVYQDDGDGDFTGYEWDVPIYELGNILAYPQTGSVHFQYCPLGDALTLTVADGAGTVYTYGPIICVELADGYRYADFQVSDYALKPGDLLTVSNGTGSKELVITPEGTHSVDVVADTIQGVNEGATHLGLWVSRTWTDVYPAQDGSWQADFSDKVDLVPGMGLAVYRDDGDGDFTGYNWNVPNPRFEVRPNIDQVRGWEWTKGAMLTLEIGGQSFPGVVGEAPWDPNQSYIEFNLAGTFDIQSGDEVSLSDGVTTKVTTVTELEITEIDTVQDIVTGKAAKGSTVDLWASDGATNFNRHVVAGEDGLWSADFSIPGSGQDEQSTVDILPGTWVDSQQVDGDWDSTMFGQNAPTPKFVVNPTAHWAYAWDWPANEELTMTIGEGGITISAITESTGLFTSSAYFDLTGIELTPGIVVYVEGAGINKSLVVTDFSVEPDALNNILSGTASPQGGVFACADNVPGNCRSATAEDGQWSMPPDPQGFVLAPGVFGWAAEEDEDGDLTRMDWWAPNFRFDARANEDVVEAWEWPVGHVLTLVINGETFTKTVETSDSDLTYVAFNLSGIVDIQPGQTVTLSDEIYTKTTVVTPLEFTHHSLIEDTVSGIAAPNSYFDIWACGPDGCPVRHVLVDESGNWSVDFAQPGAGSDEQGTLDLTPGTWIDSRETDSDSDGTMYGINAPFPTSGSATGEGWITSPAGAYVANPAFTGKATLEFNAKYSKSSPILKGTVVFTFKGFTFLSTSLDWQAIEGGRMQLTGNGTVNGKSGYGFMVVAAKNMPEAGGKYTFRIRIWDTASGQIVYDNMQGAADYVIPVTPLQGGTIKLAP